MNILVIPDWQAKPKAPTRHYTWIGKYANDLRPDVIVHLGDLWDMASLSSYDRGKKAAIGKSLVADENAGKLAVELFEAELDYAPRRVYLKGNHEYRIDRYINDYPELDGSLFDPLGYMHSRGWEVRDFLETITIGGITFSHFFPRTTKGTTTAGSCKNGASSAWNQLQANGVSCIAGHKQGLDTAMKNSGFNGRRIRSIIAGSCYLHNEGYHTPQGHDYWRGVLMLHNVKNGDFDLEEISLRRLKEWYG